MNNEISLTPIIKLFPPTVNLHLLLIISAMSNLVLTK